MMFKHVKGTAAVMCAAVLGLAACKPVDQTAGKSTPPASAAEPTTQTEGAEAPAPPPVPQADPSTATVERAAPPSIKAVVLGEFKPVDAIAENATGAIEISDLEIKGANGSTFMTERVALVSGDDQYKKDARYADVMMVEPRQAIELRHIVEETKPAKAPESAFCGANKSGYLAIAKIEEGKREIVKVLVLRGDSLPSATSEGVEQCLMTSYYRDI